MRWGVGVDVHGVEESAGGDADFAHELHHLMLVMVGGPSLYDAAELILVRYTVVIGGEAGITDQVVPLNQAQEVVPHS